MNKIIGIIPSRLKSTRVPNKPLVDIHGIPLIIHVYKRALLSKILDDVIVATDSEIIATEVKKNDGKAVLTSSSHRNGTERIAEVAKNIDCDNVVLINGDEALLNPDHISVSVKALMKSNAHASILINKFYNANSPNDFKVVLNKYNQVLYISRQDIPGNFRNKCKFYYKAYHILSFQKEFLLNYAKMEKTPLEKIEDHEHLRIIENGFRLIAKEVKSEAVSLDTYDDLEYIKKKMLKDEWFIKYANNK